MKTVELLVRLDERCEGMAADIKEIKEHQIEQNGDIKELQLEQARLRGRIYGGAAVLSASFILVQTLYLVLG